MTLSRKISLLPDGSLTHFVVAFWPPASGGPQELDWEQLEGDGSDRVFVRVRSGRETAVVVVGPDEAENLAYENIGRHLYRLGQAGPEILAVDRERGLTLVEDLGSFHLLDWTRAANAEARIPMYEDTLRLVARVHHHGLEGFDPAWCYQTREYDRALILERETGYFLKAFVSGLMNLPADRRALAGEFEALADAALDGAGQGLMLRDCQSRNVMIHLGRPRLVDFQGARLGPGGYDVASLLYDPYVNLAQETRDHLAEFYIKEREALGGFERAGHEKTLPYLTACRLLQALGAYGFLTKVRGKFLFEKYIPAAIRSLDGLLSGPGFEFCPGLGALVSEIRKQVAPI